MPRIMVTPEQGRQVSGQFKQASQQSQEMVTKLQSTVSGMQSEWEGLTKEKFYTEFQQWQTSMKAFVELLTSIGQQLDAVAARFEAADKPA
jgi:WXG100 family type VII secretion target